MIKSFLLGLFAILMLSGCYYYRPAVPVSHCNNCVLGSHYYYPDVVVYDYYYPSPYYSHCNTWNYCR